MEEGRGSIIPPGQADLALFLATLPQVSEYDTAVDLNVLLASGLNHIAKKAAWFYLRFYFAQKGLYSEDQLKKEAENDV